jgi:hypothetical protein
MIKSKPDAWRARPRGTSFMMASFIIVVLQVSFSDAFPSKTVRLYFFTFMSEYVDIMLHQGACNTLIFIRI